MGRDTNFLRQKFAGKRVLVTGASSGIGQAFAEQLHELGASLILLARRRELLEALRQRLLRQQAGQIELCPFDITDPALGEKLKQYQDVDIVINNAGRGSFGSFSESSIQDAERMVDLNATAYVRLTHHFLQPALCERLPSAFLFVSSILGLYPLSRMTVYSATKAFDLFFALGLREELKAQGIVVTTLCPGPVATQFHEVSAMPERVRNSWRATALSVADAGLRGLAHDKALVVPGVQAKLMSLPLRLLPMPLAARVADWGLRRIVR